MRKIFIICSLALSFLACTRIEEEPEVGSLTELTITAYKELDETKTSQQTDGSVFWSPGDAVSLFFRSGENGGNKFIAQNIAPSEIAEFKGSIDGFAGGGESSGGEYYFWGVYPYSQENSCDGTTITTRVSENQIGKEDTFSDNTFPTMAKSKGLSLGFFNICGGISFKVTRDDIKTVKLKGNSDEDIAGKAKVGWDSNGHPVISEIISGKKEITLSAPDGGTFIPGKKYYIICLPCVFSSGFTLTLITNNSKQGSYTHSAYTLKRGIFGNFKDLDNRITSWTDYDDTGDRGNTNTEGGTESGLYLGISTFDRNYEYYPAHLISEESLEGYNEIVDNMAIASKNGTLLYYSIDEDITALKKITLPEDLFNVSIVTFTDGLDQGSLSKKRDLYDDDSEYMNAIKDRFANEKVSNQIIKSYAIGLKGSDVQNNTTFQENLNTLASTPQNSSEKYVYMASNMTEVNNAFEKIASQLSQDFKVQKLVITIPFPSGNGTKERFVLDNKTATSSTKYIEGVFDKASLSLKDVMYYGLSSSSGEVVPITEDDGFELTYTFEDIPVSSDGEILTSNIRHYYMRPSDSSWQINSEFDNEENSRTFTEFKSAMVMLNIDLSISLSGQLSTLQQSVKSFITKLYTNSVDPEIIKSAKLNKSELQLLVGKSEALIATVSPSTAPLSNLHWNSAIPSVATVDQNGTVTGISEGTTIISVVSDEGKELATCTVHVSFQHVASISLNKSELTMFTGKTDALTATITPDDASDKSLVWTSSNSSVASVNSSGVVTANSKGTATITVQSVDGEKTATCSVTVGDYVPSAEPIDLSLAVYSEQLGRRGFITYEDLSFIDINDYVVEGLTVLSNSGNFIIALDDTELMNRWMSDTCCDLPNTNQGVTISARMKEINVALIKFDGVVFQSDLYYHVYDSVSSSYSAIKGAGGTLRDFPTYYTTASESIREVIPIESDSPHIFMTRNRSVLYSFMQNEVRHFVSNIKEIPINCEVDGVAICSSKGYGNLIIDIDDLSAGQPMTYEAAISIYGSERFMTEEQAKLLNVYWTVVNDALLQCNGTILSGLYWTKTTYSNGSHYCLYYGRKESDYNVINYTDCRYGTIIGTNDSKTAKIRHSKGGFDNSEIPLPHGI